MLYTKLSRSRRWFMACAGVAWLSALAPLAGRDQALAGGSYVAGIYHEYAYLNCATKDYCDVAFSALPRNHHFIVTQVSCTITVTGKPSIVQWTAGSAKGLSYTIKHFLSNPSNLYAPDDKEQYLALNNQVLFVIPAGSGKPHVRIGLSAPAEVFWGNCTMAGTLQAAPMD